MTIKKNQNYKIMGFIFGFRVLGPNLKCKKISGSVKAKSGLKNYHPYICYIDYMLSLTFVVS